jgi:hypothetical protein
MSVDLYGNIYLSENELVNQLLETYQEKNDIIFNMGSKQGFYLTNTSGNPVNMYTTGFYVLFEGDVPVYVGCAFGTNNIRNRTGRFLKQARMKNRPDENHPAADQYRYRFGNTFTNLKILVLPQSGLERDFALKVETALIRRFRPLLNKRINVRSTQDRPTPKRKKSNDTSPTNTILEFLQN